ncbi:hypothetical protein [Mycobacterium sp. Aquia_213]|uniref:hypothetical protein n=1 Tax=Mycobacterium sp. Aquia_213 TaxID=2991728 RepID=UPI002270F735|nr:hypothetical protein [Mycobacterium sp. Aquia_213]WAC92988.1 hypothetical protein LMQ14_07590 [Mycobacterium sp. Aquia_213]
MRIEIAEHEAATVVEDQQWGTSNLLGPVMPCGDGTLSSRYGQIGDQRSRYRIAIERRYCLADVLPHDRRPIAVGEVFQSHRFARGKHYLQSRVQHISVDRDRPPAYQLSLNEIWYRR